MVLIILKAFFDSRYLFIILLRWNKGIIMYIYIRNCDIMLSVYVLNPPYSSQNVNYGYNIIIKFVHRDVNSVFNLHWK